MVKKKGDTKIARLLKRRGRGRAWPELQQGGKSWYFSIMALVINYYLQ